jgi:hypothetical protein
VAANDDPDRLLDRSRVRVDGAEGDEPPAIPRPLAVPQVLERIEVLVGDAPALGEVGSQCGELGLQVAGPDAEDQPAAAQHVQGREGACHDQQPPAWAQDRMKVTQHPGRAEVVRIDQRSDGMGRRRFAREARGGVGEHDADAPVARTDLVGERLDRGAVPTRGAARASTRARSR